MKRQLAIFVAAGITAIVGLILMHVIPIKDFAGPPCCADTLDLKTSYGVPLPFKQVYSGGISGKGDVVTKPDNVVLDGVFVFVATAVVINAVIIVRNRREKSKLRYEDKQKY